MRVRDRPVRSQFGPLDIRTRDWRMRGAHREIASSERDGRAIDFWKMVRLVDLKVYDRAVRNK